MNIYNSVNSPLSYVVDINITNAQLNRFYAEEVQMSRDNTSKSVNIVMPIISSILKEIHQLDKRFSGEAACTGSYYQGLKVDRADEFDINVPMLGVDSLWWTSGKPLYFNVDSGILQRTNVALPPPPPGYCVIDFSNPTLPLWYNDNNLRVDGILIPFLVKKTFKELFHQAVRNTGHQDVVSMSLWRSGPALTITVTEKGHHPISVDFAPLIEQPRLSLPSSVEWPHLNTHWPSVEKKRRLQEMGVNFVVKKDMYWYISYAHMEKELIQKIDADGGCRKKLQRIMKKMRDDVWCPGNKPVLSSYHLKNLFFWECEAHPHADEWTTDKLATRFVDAVHNLLTSLKSRYLKQFFQPKVNLLAIQDEAQIRKVNDVIAKIEAFLRNPSKYIG